MLLDLVVALFSWQYKGCGKKESQIQSAVPKSLCGLKWVDVYLLDLQVIAVTIWKNILTQIFLFKYVQSSLTESTAAYRNMLAYLQCLAEWHPGVCPVGNSRAEIAVPGVGVVESLLSRFLAGGPIASISSLTGDETAKTEELLCFRQPMLFLFTGECWQLDTGDSTVAHSLHNHPRKSSDGHCSTICMHQRTNMVRESRFLYARICTHASVITAQKFSEVYTYYQASTHTPANLALIWYMDRNCIHN